jgi:hypothetical protein
MNKLSLPFTKFVVLISLQPKWKCGAPLEQRWHGHGHLEIFLPASFFIRMSLNYFFDLPIGSEVGVMDELFGVKRMDLEMRKVFQS